MMNVITGLPRSGSTLFCNIINQNPDNFATDTSVLSGIIGSMSQSISNQTESGSLDYSHVRKVTSAFADSWHDTEKIVFDKGRHWSKMGLIYKDLELGKMFVMVRDLRDVYASMEKQHRKNPLLASDNMIASSGVFERADKMFSPEGMIGKSVAGIEDLIRRNLDNVIFVQYEAFCSDPEKVLSFVDGFKYQFDNVVNVSNEEDKSYHGKFPHEGDGKVTTKNIGTWKDYLDSELADIIKNKFPFYNKTFGY